MTTTAKFDATLNYISQQVSSALALDLRRRIANAARLDEHADLDKQLLAAISTSGAGVYLSNGAARRQALRALLLCQKVYLTKITQKYDLIEIWIDNWPQVTIDYWKGRSETQIKRAIEMYMPLPQAKASDLIDAAGSHRPNLELLNKRYHRVTRDDADFPIENICYRAVQSWMLKSGFVSLQWFIKNSETHVEGATTDTNSAATKLLAMFGPGTMTNVSNGATRNLRLLPADIVYMYRGRADGTPKAAGQLGHWMLHAANRKAYGCNNFTDDEAAGTDPTYAYCSLDNQLLAMQRHQTGVGGPDHHFVRVFRPNALETFPSA